MSYIFTVASKACQYLSCRFQHCGSLSLVPPLNDQKLIPAVLSKALLFKFIHLMTSKPTFQNQESQLGFLLLLLGAVDTG